MSDRIESVRTTIEIIRSRIASAPATHREAIVVAMAYAEGALDAADDDGQHDLDGAHKAWIALCQLPANEGHTLADAAMHALDAATTLAESVRDVLAATRAIAALDRCTVRTALRLVVG